MTISYTVAPFPVGLPDKRIQKGMIAGICSRTVVVRDTQHSCQHIHAYPCENPIKPYTMLALK